MTFQYAPIAGTPTDPRKYAPHRDIAWIFQSMWRVAVVGFDREHFESWFRDYLEATGCTNDDLALCLTKFTTAFNYFVGEEQLEGGNFMQCLHKAGVFSSPNPAIICVLARLGLVTYGSFFTAIRDVSQYKTKPPEAAGFADIAAAAEDFVRRFTEELATGEAVSVDVERYQQEWQRRDRKRLEELELLRFTNQQLEDSNRTLADSLQTAKQAAAQAIAERDGRLRDAEVLQQETAEQLAETVKAAAALRARLSHANQLLSEHQNRSLWDRILAVFKF